MSGKRQHYIPQLLQRGFLSRSTSKGAYCWVYGKEQDPYETNIINIGVEDYFYGDPNDSALDSRITEMEGRHARIIEDLRSATVSQQIDRIDIAELVVHFSVRSRNVRQSFEKTGESFLNLLSGMLQEPEDLKRMFLHLLKENPDEVRKLIREEIQKRIPAGLDESMIDQLANLALANAPLALTNDIEKSHEGMMKMLHTVRDEMPKTARDGHLRGLDRSLAPEARMENISTFLWQLKVFDSAALILGDVGPWGITRDSERSLPLIWGRADMQFIIFPISDRHFVVGSADVAAAPCAPELT